MCREQSGVLWKKQFCDCLVGFACVGSNIGGLQSPSTRAETEEAAAEDRRAEQRAAKGGGPKVGRRKEVWGGGGCVVMAAAGVLRAAHRMLRHNSVFSVQSLLASSSMTFGQCVFVLGSEKTKEEHAEQK